MSSENTAVLIVGGGPSGLAAAIELGLREVPCVLIEQNDRVGYAPRAKTTHARTREHLRRWGIADRLAAASPFGVDYPANVYFVTRLGGYELTRIENAFNCDPTPSPLYSEHAQWIPQYKLEQTLKDFAASLSSVELRFSCALERFEESPSGICATVRDVTSGTESRIDATYLVGADGARSVVRDAIGAQMKGTYGLSRNLNIIFRAPGFDRAHPHGPGIMYWQVNPEIPSLIGPMDQDDLWFFMPTGIGDALKGSLDGAADLIRRSTGIDLPIEVLSSDEWVASRLIADRYRKGNVFLIGDACHLHPPFGGYGMNMGVSDGVDLGWKLAATLAGWGGPQLLDSYEAERRPVHQKVIDEAVANHAVLGNQLWRDGLERDDAHGDAQRREIGEEIRRLKRREFKSLGIVLGLCYQESPIVAPSSEKYVETGETYHPSAHPGCLAPHAWVREGLSLYDLFGSDFTLLSTEVLTDRERAEILGDAEVAGLPLIIVELPDYGLKDIYNARLILIRPDQHVAWRGEQWPGNSLLNRASGWN